MTFSGSDKGNEGIELKGPGGRETVLEGSWIYAHIPCIAVLVFRVPCAEDDKETAKHRLQARSQGRFWGPVQNVCFFARLGQL